MSSYVMSDLHGRHDLFLEMLQKIRFSDEDRLYVLGDVADRGPDGIRTYFLMMKNSRMELIAGNHEIMFLAAYEKSLACADTGGFYDSEEWRLWEYNGGRTTWEKFSLLTETEKTDLIRYLKNACLLIPDLKAGGRDYYLCHSAHASVFVSSALLLKDASPQEISHVVWDRVYPEPERQWKEDGNTVLYHDLYTRYPKKTKMVFGHTPTGNICGTCPDGRSRIWHGGAGHLIDIDCGCASYLPEHAMLGCLRLDDLREFYVHGRKKHRR